MYNNPYDMNFYPYNYFSQKPPKASLFGGLKKYNWNNFLNGTGKTLNVINQAIPIIYQVRPIINNAITMFRVMNAVRGSDDNKSTSDTVDNRNTRSTNMQVNTSTNNNERSSTSSKRNSDDESSLTFFI